MILLEAEPLDLGSDVRAVGLELTEGADREPLRGPDGARVWSLALPCIAGAEPWVLDFNGDVKLVREFCQFHGVVYRQVSDHSLVVPSLQADVLQQLCERFESDTFGMRAGGRLETADAILEADLAQKGLDAYHLAYPAYSFCALCNFDEGSVVLLSNSLWASEIVRRVKAALASEDAQVRLAT